MQFTTNNNLKKPELTDPALISDINDNMDIIDAAIAKCNFTATANPTVNDDGLDGYTIGSKWFNLTLNTIFILQDNTTGAAVWRQIWPALATDIDLSLYYLKSDIDLSLYYLKSDITLSDYVLLAGKSPYQIIYGSLDSGGCLYLRSTSNATKGKIYFGAGNDTVFDEVNDRVGIGIANPAYNLHVNGTFGLDGTCSNIGESTFRFRRTYETTVNGNYTHTINYISPYINIANSVTNSGYLRGIFIEMLRNRAGDNGTIGTQANIQALLLTYGHYSNAAINPLTTNVYGIYLNPYYKSGTITNMYDIYLTVDQTGGTVTNRWGYYQANTARNRFGGYIGIGVDPTVGLQLPNAATSGKIICYDVYAYNNISALSFTDRTKGYSGNNALNEIAKIKNDKDGNIDHDTLPEFAKSTKNKHDNEKNIDKIVVERDLGNMISILTSGMQELIEKNNELLTRIKKLESKNSKNQ